MINVASRFFRAGSIFCKSFIDIFRAPLYLLLWILISCVPAVLFFGFAFGFVIDLPGFMIAMAVSSFLPEFAVLLFLVGFTYRLQKKLAKEAVTFKAACAFAISSWKPIIVGGLLPFLKLFYIWGCFLILRRLPEKLFSDTIAFYLVFPLVLSTFYFLVSSIALYLTGKSSIIARRYLFELSLFFLFFYALNVVSSNGLMWIVGPMPRGGGPIGSQIFWGLYMLSFYPISFMFFTIVLPIALVRLQRVAK